MKSKLERYSKIIANRLHDYDANNYVEIRTSFELKNEQLSKLKDAISKRFAIKPNFRVIVDPSIIGGLLVKVDSEIIDSSLKTKLKQIININEKEGL